MADSPGPGSAGNVLVACIQFVLAGVLWIFWLGWLVHLWSVFDAAIYRGR